MPFSRDELWLRLWACARIDLGLGSDEFWSLTPRQFAALLNRRVAIERVKDVRSAYMPWLYYNAHRNKQPEREIEFFMPTVPPPRPRSGGLAVIERFREIQAARATIGSRAKHQPKISPTG